MIKIRRNFKKKWRVASGNQRNLKVKKFIGLRKFHSQKSSPAKRGFSCETISQPRRPYCEIEVLLRNKPPFAKSFHSHKPTSCENFRSCETPVRHTCAISQLRNPPKPNFIAQAPPAKIFAAVKQSLGTRVAFGSPTTPLRNCKMACKTPYEITHWLRNRLFAAKWAFSCENLNRHLNPKLSL